MFNFQCHLEVYLEVYDIIAVSGIWDHNDNVCIYVEAPTLGPALGFQVVGSSREEGPRERRT